MALVPEVINNQKYDQTVDVWSFGLFVLELILGRHPYKAENGDDISCIFIDDDPIDVYRDVILERFSSELIHFLRRCLTKDPTSRSTVPSLMNEYYLYNASLDHKDFIAWL